MALTLACDDKLLPGSPSSCTLPSRGDGYDCEASSSWTMELSRWRVRLRRLKRWSRYEGRASDGQFDTHDVPDTQRLRSASEQQQPVRLRHSLTSVGSVASSFAPPPRASIVRYCAYEPVVPPVRIPSIYRQQDKQRGVRVGGDRVPFTLDGHKRRRKIMRPLPPIHESEPFEYAPLPDMRNSMAMVYARMGRPTRSRRAKSV